MATIVEFSHRLTSGLALLLVVRVGDLGLSQAVARGSVARPTALRARSVLHPDGGAWSAPGLVLFEYVAR
jgi:hypothetical protein